MTETDRSTPETDRGLLSTTRTGMATTANRIGIATNTSVVAASLIQNLYNGTPIAAVSARAELPETDSVLRLRVGLLNEGKNYTADGVFKLQSGVYVGTCDPSSTSYTDVGSATSPFAFYDNSFATTNAFIHTDAADPAYLSSRPRMQSYVESNTFTNPREMKVGDLGIWDFALKSDGTRIGRTYCFRVVESAASLSGGYGQYAEVYVPPVMENVMRHGAFFNTRGVQQPYAWGRE